MIDLELLPADYCVTALVLVFGAATVEIKMFPWSGRATITGEKQGGLGMVFAGSLTETGRSTIEATVQQMANMILPHPGLQGCPAEQTGRDHTELQGIQLSSNLKNYYPEEKKSIGLQQTVGESVGSETVQGGNSRVLGTELQTGSGPREHGKTQVNLTPAVAETSTSLGNAGTQTKSSALGPQQENKEPLQLHGSRGSSYMVQIFLKMKSTKVNTKFSWTSNLTPGHFTTRYRCVRR